LGLNSAREEEISVAKEEEINSAKEEEISAAWIVWHGILHEGNAVNPLGNTTPGQRNTVRENEGENLTGDYQSKLWYSLPRKLRGRGRGEAQVIRRTPGNAKRVLALHLITWSDLKSTFHAQGGD